MVSATLGWFGPAISELVNQIIPPGGLPLVQLVPAVLLGLIAVDTYGASDRRRDAGRLVAGADPGPRASILGLSLGPLLHRCCCPASSCWRA